MVVPHPFTRAIFLYGDPIVVPRHGDPEEWRERVDGHERAGERGGADFEKLGGTEERDARMRMNSSGRDSSVSRPQPSSREHDPFNDRLRPLRRCPFQRYFVAVTTKSVNHRFLEVSVRMPEFFWELEPAVRAIASETFSRGKLDISIRVRERSSPNTACGSTRRSPTWWCPSCGRCRRSSDWDRHSPEAI